MNLTFKDKLLDKAEATLDRLEKYLPLVLDEAKELRKIKEQNEVEIKELREKFSLSLNSSQPIFIKENKHAITQKVRWFILKRDKFRCVKCGVDSKEAKLEIDHIIPKARGGTNSVHNLQTLCFSCNHGKNDEVLNCLI